MTADSGPDPLGHVSRVLAVVAHPDDESFGLGAVLSGLVGRGIPASLICFTHGEASTLHAGPGELSAVRAQELHAAAVELSLSRVDLCNYRDGHLDRLPLDELTGPVLRMIVEEHPSHLLVFDPSGVTGHSDHRRATEAAVTAARVAGLPVLAWMLPRSVAQRLNAELGTSFTGQEPAGPDITLTVSRQRQWRAIACHTSQSTDNPVLRRRLQLQGDREHLRLIPPPTQEGDSAMSYGITLRLSAPFASTVDRVRAALKDQGFGVLTEIDVQATLREKLGVQMEDYLILGACNPPLVHRALDVDRDIGLLLPCNVLVRADGPDVTLVQALDPQVMVQVAGEPELKDVADEAATRLRAALDALAA
jgi:N-acetylglucosamine malate deacetylase 2